MRALCSVWNLCELKDADDLLLETLHSEGKQLWKRRREDKVTTAPVAAIENLLEESSLILFMFSLLHEVA